MDTTELIGLTRSAGLFPIPVEGEADCDEKSGLLFAGSLEQFFEAAKALGATAAFLMVSKLEETDFHYKPDLYDNDDSNEERAESDETTGDEESFELTAVLPSLAEFKQHVGEEYAFLLTAVSQLATLSIYLSEGWWDSFTQQRDKAIQRVDGDREAIREKIEKQRLQREEGVMKQVRSLLDDPEFCRIPTQRAMKAYALEKFPELEDVNDERLTDEIQRLSDKAKLKKRR